MNENCHLVAAANSHAQVFQDSPATLLTTIPPPPHGQLVLVNQGHVLWVAMMHFHFQVMNLSHTLKAGFKEIFSTKCPIKY